MPIQVSDEPWIPRRISYDMAPSEEGFSHEIQNRDRRCVISGRIISEANIQADNWIGFQAAHIFPPEQETHWVQHNYGRWITDIHDTSGSSKIDSCQNGFLLDVGIHQTFNQYFISVNPDDNYKIVVFDTNHNGLDGRNLEPVCRNPANPHSVSDQLLRWHYRQSVLANVRRSGEPIFEHDFPPGSDMMSEILDTPYGKERLELELAARLRGF